MGKLTDIEMALNRNDVKKINDFIKSGGNIYQELDKVSHFYVKETLMTRACREHRTDIVQILLDVYEKDYKSAEKFVSNEKDKDFLLKYVFIAWSEEEIKEILLLNSKKSQNKSKKNVVFLADRRECVLVPIVDDKELMFRLCKNGFLTINSREQNGGNPGYLVGSMNRLDLLKRMIAIGLNYKDTPRSCEGNDLNFIGKILSQSKCIGLIKYCLTELNLDHEDLLQFTSKNKSIQVFEYVLEYVTNKNGSGCKKDYLLKYCEKNDIFCAYCGSSRNFILIAHLLTVYGVQKDPFYYMYLLKEPNCAEYIKEILEIEKDNFDDLLAAIEMDVNISVLEQTWKALNKTTLKAINKNNVKMIIICYISLIYEQSETKEYFHMVDPLAIYDEQKGDTALFIALERNCEPLVRHLISKGADLRHKNKEGHTTLTAACRYCTPEIIRFLLKMDLSLINEVGSNGHYPLNELITRGDCFVDVFNKIIKVGADINILDQFGNTLLHNAVVAQNIEFVKACLEAGLDPSIKGYNDDTALHSSTKSKSLEIFELILNTGKVDIESKNYRGNTILHNVCKSYFPHFFFSFIEIAKPNINALNNDGQPPIYLCFEKDKFNKLLDMGADTTLLEKIDVPFNTGASFQYLTKCFSKPDFDLSTLDDDNKLLHSIPRMHIPNNRENLKEMLIKSINFVSPSDWNSSGFQTAAASNNLPFLQNMFKYGEPHLELKDDLGETALFKNLRYVFNKEVLKYLIEKGADVNTQNNEGDSLIFVSVFAEGTEILLKAGASTKILNKKGETALHRAAQRNDLEICLLLLSYGADINLLDEDNKKPSDLCTYKHLKDFLLFISE